jgi:enoyl-CoA hydratase
VDLIKDKQGAVALVTINREKAFNALDAALLEDLARVFKEFETDDSVRAVIITGAGAKAFVAGADIKEIKAAGAGRPALIRRGLEALGAVRDCAKPVIAAVNGLALGGGCELAMSCDLRLASATAKFALPEATLGLMPGFGGTQLLPRLVGEGRAKLMMFSGAMISAEEALAMGLVEAVHPSEALLGEAKSLAEKIAMNGPFALGAIKRALHQGRGLNLDAALEAEQTQYGRVAGSEDAEAGLDAFVQKRSPVFQGK